MGGRRIPDARVVSGIGFNHRFGMPPILHLVESLRYGLRGLVVLRNDTQSIADGVCFYSSMFSSAGFDGFRRNTT